ncbi:Superoxide dismutase [Mn] 1 [Lacunisphaera limnophila]|uniref:Superoxide dismutase n=1 Tax=Lacunisphaera limnophila TaxID=1838286 RepID=A0A1D8AZL6_9BACT|nr:superoxide dismutase [Lacunisphaera limnophila]AOS46325.1 Superoxide dismutase [Mn] 1 [Lacunisphaera limnophila]
MNPVDPASLSRREALKILGTTAAVAGLGLHRLTAAESAPVALGWDLPKLPYAYGALEPHFDARTMEIHHSKHHQAYITNARNLLKDHPDLLARGPEALVRDLASVPEAIRTGIRNNAGGHVNHDFFWKIIAPGSGVSVQQLPVAIAEAFGSMDEFKKLFADAAMKRFGSGWAWLSLKDGKLLVHSTANQDSPLSEGATPILGLDVWEHAYYLQYQNRRADFVAAYWNVVNWTQAEVNFAQARKS